MSPILQTGLQMLNGGLSVLVAALLLSSLWFGGSFSIGPPANPEQYFLFRIKGWQQTASHFRAEYVRQQDFERRIAAATTQEELDALFAELDSDKPDHGQSPL